MTEVQNFMVVEKKAYKSVMSCFNTLTHYNMESYGLLTNIGLNIWGNLR